MLVVHGSQQDFGKLALTLKGHTNRVAVLPLSLDGNKLASGSADNTVRLWDAALPRNSELTPAEKMARQYWSGREE